MIENYYQYNSHLASGAQPSEAQFADLKEAASLETLLKIHQPEQKWFDYFRLMGMEGVK